MGLSNKLTPESLVELNEGQKLIHIKKEYVIPIIFGLVAAVTAAKNHPLIAAYSAAATVISVGMVWYSYTPVQQEICARGDNHRIF